MSTTEQGSQAEDLAVTYLVGLGYRLIERNFRCHGGEIDIIAQCDDMLCFVEVRSFSDPEHGDPLETIGAGKIRRILQSAKTYLNLNYGDDSQWPAMRFDAVGVVTTKPPKITLIQQAFDATSTAGVSHGAPMGVSV